MFSEKASAIARMRQKFCFIGKRGTFQNASEMRQNCVKNARNTFGEEHLLDDTDVIACPPSVCEIQRNYSYVT